ncbi:MAG: hypothetical protein AELANPGJ_03480 [Anaerolineae bacterium]|nr:hypothetical protein [Anaerolineae bacterium]
MRLDFERDIECVVERDDAGVVDESRAHPRLSELFGRGTNVRLEQAVDFLRDRLAVGRSAVRRAGVGDLGAEGFVYAVFRPRLRQHFEFDISRVALNLLEIRLNRAHLVEIEREPPVFAEIEQGVAGKPAHRDDLDRVVGGLNGDERRADGRIEADAVDHCIDQHPARDSADVGIG